MYLTIKKELYPHYKIKQLTFEDFLAGLGIPEDTQYNLKKSLKNLTIEKPEENFQNFFNNQAISERAFTELKSIMDLPIAQKIDIDNIKEHYSEFFIPKKSGGLRKIDAPDDDLKLILKLVKEYLEKTLMILPHESAHAYVHSRSTLTSLKVHQANESKWFLKLDLKDFFPSHTKEYIMKTISNIYPIGFLLKDPEYKKLFERAIDLALLDNALPQGTPLSPTLTNLLMVSIDYQIMHALYKRYKNVVYTRYADDMLISSKYKFNPKETEKLIKDILRNNECPFQIKSEKTRFGSSAGQNWNLGVMLNKDNNLTIGHRQNQKFRAMLFNIFKDHESNIQWTPEDKAVLGGLISYYKSIEPEYVTSTIAKYEQKFGITLKKLLKN